MQGIAQNSGSITVRNSGAYVARFSVSYNLDGRQVIYNSGDFPVAQSRTLQIPLNACCGRLRIENLVFIAIWRDVTSFDFTLPYFKCFSIGGTTFNPSWAENGC